MMAPVDVPRLDTDPTPPRRGIISRVPLASRVFRGAAITRAQVQPHAAEWAASNERDWRRDGPLWVVLGDSTAQGIGASRYDRGYVGQLRDTLDARAGPPWRVLNLSRSGDRVEDVVHNQLPIVQRLEVVPALVTAIAGANDLLRTPLPRLAAQFHTLAGALPAGSVIGTCPQGIRMARARAINAVIAAEAAANDLRVADIWTASGPPWRGKFAADQFHPNDTGYALWAEAIAAAMDVS